jgi:hypothetical protein
VDAEELADEAAEDDYRQSAEQPVGQPLLPPGFAAGDHRSEEDAGRQERGGRPEDRELHVPGPHHVVWQELRQVETEEACYVRLVML